MGIDGGEIGEYRQNVDLYRVESDYKGDIREFGVR